MLLPQLRRIHRDVEQGHAVGERVVKNRCDDVGRVVGQFHHAASPESGAQFGIHKKQEQRVGKSTQAVAHQAAPPCDGQSLAFDYSQLD